MTKNLQEKCLVGWILSKIFVPAQSKNSWLWRFLSSSNISLAKISLVLFLLQTKQILRKNKPIQDGGEAKAPLWLNRLSGTNWLTDWRTNKQGWTKERLSPLINMSIKCHLYHWFSFYFSNQFKLVFQVFVIKGKSRKNFQKLPKESNNGVKAASEG